MEATLVEFDRLFDTIVQADSIPRSGSGLRQAVSGEGEHRVRQAVASFYRGEYRRCLNALRDLGEEAQNDPLIAAFMGASTALALGEVRIGLNACVNAVRRGFFLPDVYCALGVVLLTTGDRAKALAAFKRGLAVDPSHRELRARTRSMGQRRRPVIPFLARSHLINRVLGRIRWRLAAT